MDEFLDLVKTSGLENDLMMSGKNMTVFVPSNDAIDDFRHDMEEVGFVKNYILQTSCVYQKNYEPISFCHILLSF